MYVSDFSRGGFRHLADERRRDRPPVTSMTGNVTRRVEPVPWSPDGNEVQPAWSPDGTRIVYVSDRSGGDHDIWVMNADGTGQRNMHDNNNPEWKPAWSPHGDRIIFAHNTGKLAADDDIWTMDAQTGQNWRLITTATANGLRFNAAAESNPTWSPSRDDRQIRISWGSDASNRPDCPSGTTCWNLEYEYVGTWGSPPYTLECWANGRRGWVGQWTGRPATGCYYWAGTAHVEIDGIRSNSLPVPEQPAPDDRQVRISWGSDAGGRADCPEDTMCWNLEYEYLGNWGSPPYTLECWSNGQQDWVGQWTGRPTTGCYYWAGTAHVVIDGIASNQLPIPMTPPAEDPPVLAPAMSIAAGFNHTCALRTDGTVACWGSNQFGEPTAPAGVFTTVSAASDHTCALRVDGTAVCWGSYFRGEGPPGGTFKAISAGGQHTCGLRADGEVECWGADSFGQATPPAGAFAAVAADLNHTCGLRRDGTVTCWGNRPTLLISTGEESSWFPSSGTFTVITGRCGIEVDGTVDCWLRYGDVPEGRFAAISSGGNHSCGLRPDGTVACWGENAAGQATAPSGTFTAVDAGWEHSCGIRTDGVVECWGYADGRDTPPSGRFSAVSASKQSCGLRADRTAECWGYDVHGESSPPAGTFRAVATGISFTCGLRTNGRIECWGLDHYGGETSPPTGTFTAISSGFRHSCGIRTNRTVACWGSDDLGQATPPTGSFTDVAVGILHSCGLRTDGTIECWGDENVDPPTGTYSSLTDGCGIQTDGTVECWKGYRAPAGRFTALSGGPGHWCGIKTDGTVECWGSNPDGRATPPSGTFTAIAAGYEHSCGVRTDGTVVCWGYDDGRTTPPGGRFGPAET